MTAKWWQNDHKVMASSGLVGIDFYEIMFLKSRTCFFEVLLQNSNYALWCPDSGPQRPVYPLRVGLNGVLSGFNGKDEFFRFFVFT